MFAPCVIIGCGKVFTAVSLVIQHSSSMDMCVTMYMYLIIDDITPILIGQLQIFNYCLLTRDTIPVSSYTWLMYMPLAVAYLTDEVTSVFDSCVPCMLTLTVQACVGS